MKAKVAVSLCLSLLILVGCQKAGNSMPPPVPENDTEQTATVQEDTSTQAAFSPGDYQFVINVDGLKRTYIVHVPRGYDVEKPLPVVIVLHGGGGTGEGTMEMTKMPAKADEAGFLAVFPDGTRPFPSEPAKFWTNPQTWNDDSGRGYSGKRNVDDIGFINAMIDDIATKFKVDQQRIYATGLSNGASMTFRLGVELSQRIAAIAPVAGAFWMENPQLSRPVPILYITGSDDPLNPIEGGPISVPWWGYSDVKPPVQDTIMKWVNLIGCPDKPEVIYDNNGIKALAYKLCQGNAEVIYYTVEGLGHHWPGGKSEPYLPEGIVGKTSNKLIANDVIWEFFQKHSVK